jgi:WD40 repeat protein
LFAANYYNVLEKTLRMNLELLDPFGRQVPDRIDATIELPSALHFRSNDGKEEKKGKSNHTSSTDPTEWKSAYHVVFSRRGTYVAVGYGSGTVGVFNMLSRTLSALYRNEDTTATPASPGIGISSVSWSRRSRTLLAGSLGDATVRLFDTSHPYGPDEANSTLLMVEKESEDDAPFHRTSQSREEQAVSHFFEQTQTTSFADLDQRFDYQKQSRLLQPVTMRVGDQVPKVERLVDVPLDARGVAKYPAITFQLPRKVGGSLQVNPRIPTAGLAVLDDGSLIVFWEHASVWVETKAFGPILVPIWEDSAKHHITCASFDPSGNRIYAASKDGRAIGFDVSAIWKVLMTKANGRSLIAAVTPWFNIVIPGASSSWHLLVSRSGKCFVINSADGALRLFSAHDCWETPDKVEKPTFIFQDVVSKVKFASCDLSGDGEYLVGGANGSDYKYEVSSTFGSTCFPPCILTPPAALHLEYVYWSFDG